jgi:hypothetical protein
MKSRIAVIALVAFALSTTAFAGTEKVNQLNFPKAGIYEIHSNPSFLIKVGANEETVTCKATLVVQAGDPYINADGNRHVDLKVVNWKAEGTSELLGGPLKFRMEQGKSTEDKSFVESYRLDSKDFPARAQFAVPYELETPFGTVRNLYGVTRGAIKSFPPTNDVFSMEKGDIVNLMAQLMPEPLSELSAAGDLKPAEVEIHPIECACSELDSQE